MSQVQPRREWRVTWVGKSGKIHDTALSGGEEARQIRTALRASGKRDIHVYSRVVAETPWEEEDT